MMYCYYLCIYRFLYKPKNVFMYQLLVKMVTLWLFFKWFFWVNCGFNLMGKSCIHSKFRHENYACKVTQFATRIFTFKFQFSLAIQNLKKRLYKSLFLAHRIYIYIFLSGFSFTTIIKPQNCRERGRTSLWLLTTTSTRFTDT